jgi:hypothetical protein
MLSRRFAHPDTAHRPWTSLQLHTDSEPAVNSFLSQALAVGRWFEVVSKVVEMMGSRRNGKKGHGIFPQYQSTIYNSS